MDTKQTDGKFSLTNLTAVKVDKQRDGDKQSAGELKTQNPFQEGMVAYLNLDNVSGVKDLSINWNTSRLAVSCEHGEIRIYKRVTRDYKETWDFMQSINLSSECRKLKWAHSDLGNAFIVLTEDVKVSIYREMQITIMIADGIPSKKMSWEAFPVIDEHSVETYGGIRDVKFAPSHFGFAVTILYNKGLIEVKSLQDIQGFMGSKGPGKVLLNHQISSNMKSISWKKDTDGPSDAFVVAYTDQGRDNSSKDRISIWGYKNGWSKLDPLTQLNQLLNYDVEDVNWAIRNGRSYHSLACAGVDGLFIWRMTIKYFESQEPKIEFLDYFSSGGHPSSFPIKVKFNYLGSFAVTVNKLGKMKIWKKDGKRNWIEEFPELTYYQ